jgi:nitrite reductase/ring-hydroxylating ferredoxin subunit
MAVYRRRVQASLARVWENVLDWEHLPWLHRSSFLGIELLERRGDGWRARVTVPPAERARRALVDVRLHRPDLFYWTRTLEGAGAGTEILTTLAPVTERATDIAVEFFAPQVARARRRDAGEAYTRLYTRLWNEDEAMMIRRQAQLDARGSAGPARLELGPLRQLRARLPLVAGSDGRRARLLEIGGEVVVHAADCPHRGGPLEEGEVCGAVLVCPWHGYRFDVRTGASSDGRGLLLRPAPRLEVDTGGNAALVWDA